MVVEARMRSETVSSRLLEAAVSRQNDILVITEGERIAKGKGLKIVYVNDAFIRLTGYSREEAIGATPGILLGAKTQRSELCRIAAALDAGEPVRAELIIHDRRGEQFWLEIEVAPFADENGRRTHWVSAGRDITERKRAEEQARISQERFRLLAEATNDVLWDYDLVTGAVWRNDGFNQLFGISGQTSDARLESWINSIHPDDRDRVLASFRAAIESAASNWGDEYRAMRANGQVVVMVDRAFILRDDTSRAVRVSGTARDVTERRDLDERLRQAQKLETVGRLTGGVAHDFNNLLTVILANAELLGEELADRAELHGLSELIAAAAERGAQLTHRLLAFARRQPLEPKVIDINRLLDGMEEMLRRTLGAAIEIRVRRAPGLWLAEADPAELESALLNLALNARDAMPAGGRLAIDTANVTVDEAGAIPDPDVDPGEYVMIAVSDTGAGMAPDVLARAFEPFFTTKDVGRGAGLGLSMVYGFAKQSGGHARFESEVGTGTTIRLYLPRAAALVATPERRTEDARPVGGGEHILVVEDDPLVREGLSAQLGGLGYQVISANSGSRALWILEQTPDIDLLFTDIVMPGGMNGRQLATAAKRLRPDLKVLFTSGYTDNAVLHQGRLDPGVHLLNKPYRRRAMIEKVRAVLDEPPEEA
jgi:PAS domain S-box-containing protein